MTDVEITIADALAKIDDLAVRLARTELAVVALQRALARIAEDRYRSDDEEEKTEEEPP